METTAPKAASLVGYKHNWRSTEKTANPESTFYGHKSAKIGSGTLKGNQRYVDLKALEANGKHWHAVLQTIEDDWWNYLRGLVAQAQDQTQVWQAAEQAFEELVGPRKY